MYVPHLFKSCERFSCRPDRTLRQDGTRVQEASRRRRRLSPTAEYPWRLRATGRQTASGLGPKGTPVVEGAFTMSCRSYQALKSATVASSDFSTFGWPVQSRTGLSGPEAMPRLPQPQRRASLSLARGCSTKAMPNRSVEETHNGIGPRGPVVHHAPRGPMPLRAPHLQR